MRTQKDVIDYTNYRIKNWYVNAKMDYNVDGKGTARIEGNMFIVDYIENGEAKTHKQAFYTEYLKDHTINYFYDVWAEEG